MKLCFIVVIKNICILKKEKKRILLFLGSLRLFGWLFFILEYIDFFSISELVREICLRWWRSGEFFLVLIWVFLIVFR